MKRRAFLRHLQTNGCFLDRDDGPHSVWKNPKTGDAEAVPRHTEINIFLVRKICREPGILLPPDKA